MSGDSIEPNELSSLLQRAQEIADESQRLLEPRPDLDAYVRAAEEAGIARDATLQALRERIRSSHSFEEGSHVFAKSADGAFYVGVVQETDGPLVGVRFVNGSKKNCPPEDLQTFSMTPGSKVQVFSSGFWWDASVQSVNDVARSVTVDIWGSPQVHTFEHVRLAKVKAPWGSRWSVAAVAVSSALAGGVLGTIITLLLRR